jgi:hydroxyethylthiazole kinase-like uncharacterized protein yjeF
MLKYHTPGSVEPCAPQEAFPLDDALLAPVAPEAHKYTRGVVGIVAGSGRYPGAAVLCVGGARRGGAGYVKYVKQHEEPTAAVLARFPDVVPVSTMNSQKVDAWVIGPGAPRVVALPVGEVPLVLDGAAMRRARVPRPGITVVTPHEGELRYLDFELKDREATAKTIARTYNVIVVLKGRRTIVEAPEQAAWVDEIGGPELACAGSGDVLAGLIGSMLASWRPLTIVAAAQVVCRSVRYHSLAAKLARTTHNPVVATDLLDALPKVNL